MRFTKVCIRNFLSIGEEQIVSLDRAGLVLVTGENKDSRAADSNGAGKSTILESLVWGLWGSTIRNLKSDEVVNRTAKKNCRVSVTLVDEMEDPPVEYEVIRTRKDKSSKKAADLHLLVNGNAVTAGTNVNTQELVNTVVGMSQNTFTQAVMLSAGGRSFCEMTDSDQKSVLDDILQLESLQKARAVVKTKIFEAESAIAVVASSLDKSGAQYESMLQSVKGLQGEEEAFAGKRRDRLIGQLKLKTETAEKGEAYADAYNLKEAVEALDDVRVQFVAMQEKDNKLATKLSEVMSNAHEVRLGLSRKVAVLDAKKADVSKNVRSVNQLVGADCPTCTQHVHPDTAEEFLEKWEDQIGKIDALTGKLESKITEGQDAAHLSSSSIEKERTTIREDIVTLQDRLQEAIECVKKSEHATDQVFSCWQLVTSLDQNILALKEEKNPYTEIIKDLKDDLSAQATARMSDSYKLKSIEIKLKHLRFWAAGFGNQGMKSYMLDNVIPFLTERAQKYADILSGGDLQISFATQTKLKGGKLKEQFQVKVINSQGADVYKGNSSGEKRRSDIAVGWALGDLAATRARKPIRFKGLDEPFESLDEVGEDAVIKLLHEVLPEYETILCITHSSHLKNQFPKELTVVKEGGYSKIKV